MTVYSFFWGGWLLSDPVVWITIATVSCHSPFGYAVTSITVFQAHISFWDCQSSVRTREGPLASRLWWRLSEECLKGRACGPAPESRRPSRKAAHPLPKSNLSEKPCLAPGCLSGHSFHCDPGDTGRTSSVAAASHTPHKHSHRSSILHVCDHFLNKSSCVFCSQGTARLLISFRQKRKLYLVVNDRNRPEDMKSKIFYTGVIIDYSFSRMT